MRITKKHIENMLKLRYETIEDEVKLNFPCPEVFIENYLSKDERIPLADGLSQGSGVFFIAKASNLPVVKIIQDNKSIRTRFQTRS